MRRKLESPVAVLAKAIGYGQKDFADLVGCSAALLQSIELGRRALSQPLAERIAAATGIKLSWLQSGKGRPRDWKGRVYTRERFAEFRAMLENEGRDKIAPEYIVPQSLEELASCVALVGKLIDAADARDKSASVAWRIREALLSIGAELGVRRFMPPTAYVQRNNPAGKPRVYVAVDPMLRPMQDACLKRADARRKRS